jgi:prefoldin subunit 5
MDEKRKQLLRDAGWNVADTGEFLKLSEQEMASIREMEEAYREAVDRVKYVGTRREQTQQQIADHWFFSTTGSAGDPNIVDSGGSSGGSSFGIDLGMAGANQATINGNTIEVGGGDWGSNIQLDNSAQLSIDELERRVEKLKKENKELLNLIRGLQDKFQQIQEEVKNLKEGMAANSWAGETEEGLF